MFKILCHIPHTLFVSDILWISDITKMWWSCPNTVILPFHPVILLEYIEVAAPHFSFFIFVIIQIFCLFMIILWLLWRVRKLELICPFPSYAEVHAEDHVVPIFWGVVCIWSDSSPILATVRVKGSGSNHILRKFSSWGFFSSSFSLIDCQ